MSLTNYAEALTLDWLYTTTSITRPTVWYLGLFTAAPGETGGGTEVSGFSYVRMAVTFTRSGTAPTQVANNALIEWPAATGSWGTITHIALFDASSAGNMLNFATLTASKVIGNGDIFRVPSANFVVTLD